MSQLKVKEVLLGDNADPSKNFVLSVPAVADGTLSIKRQDGTNVLSIDATGKAVIPGVVGTVAQVGGVPTGQVVESGSNSNGWYVRFADGTQICTFIGVGVNANTANGQIFTSSASSTWTFPAAFSEAPKVTGSVGSTLRWCGFGLPTTTTVIASHYSATSDGRWF
jgi:hypothetical protein